MEHEINLGDFSLIFVTEKDTLIYKRFVCNFCNKQYKGWKNCIKHINREHKAPE